MDKIEKYACANCGRRSVGVGRPIGHIGVCVYCGSANRVTPLGLVECDIAKLPVSLRNYIDRIRAVIRKSHH